MSLSKFTGEVNVIQSLPDKPTATAAELKAEFDKAPGRIKTYINSTLTEELDIELAKIGNKKSNADFALLTGTMEIGANGYAYANLNYPSGFNVNNAVVISTMSTPLSGAEGYRFGEVISVTGQGSQLNPKVFLESDNIVAYALNSTSSSKTISYKIVLMKIS